jgi:hypothetical protein
LPWRARRRNPLERHDKIVAKPSSALLTWPDDVRRRIDVAAVLRGCAWLGEMLDNSPGEHLEIAGLQG